MKDVGWSGLGGIELLSKHCGQKLIQGFAFLNSSALGYIANRSITAGENQILADNYIFRVDVAIHGTPVLAVKYIAHIRVTLRDSTKRSFDRAYIALCGNRLAESACNSFIIGFAIVTNNTIIVVTSLPNQCIDFVLVNAAVAKLFPSRRTIANLGKNGTVSGELETNLALIKDGVFSVPIRGTVVPKDHFGQNFLVHETHSLLFIFFIYASCITTVYF